MSYSLSYFNLVELAKLTGIEHEAAKKLWAILKKQKKATLSYRVSVINYYIIKLCLDPTKTEDNVWGMYMSVELPLFLSKTEENPLSQEEIQHNFLALVHCADQTEKELFNKDLQKEELKE